VSIKDLDIDGQSQYIQEGNLEVRTNKEGKKYTAMFSVVEDGSLIQMRDLKGNTIAVSNIEGLIISDKFAETLGVKEGDSVNWRFSGEKWGDIKIGRIVINSLPKVLFISKDVWNNMNQDFQPTAILSDNNKSSLESYLDKKDSLVYKIITNESQRDSMKKVFDSTNSIIFVLLFAAILLVTVVLSSLGLLNYTEMEREYATLKVLGLYPIEIRILAFKESLLLSFTGWLIGIPCGKIFVDIFMKILSNDTIVCLSYISFKSYFFASLLVVGGSLVINLLLSIKIGKIDMVLSLKSNE
jgi:putative ABC transport system permease protein